MFHLYSNFLKKDISYIRDCPHLVDARGGALLNLRGYLLIIMIVPLGMLSSFYFVLLPNNFLYLPASIGSLKSLLWPNNLKN